MGFVKSVFEALDLLISFHAFSGCQNKNKALNTFWYNTLTLIFIYLKYMKCACKNRAHNLSLCDIIQ